jgi:DnaJ-domain-containing protein 1
MVPPLVAVALDHYRDPTAFERLRDPWVALPEGFPRMLADFSSALAANNIDETAAGLSVEPAELEDAARFLVRHLLLDAPDDYYRCLGVRYNAPTDLIKSHYLLLSRILHPDRVPNAAEIDVQYARRLNQAYQVLHDPSARAQYDFSRGVRRHRRPSDPQLFFRRRQPAAPWPASADIVRRSPGIRAPLRLIVPAVLLVAGATLLAMTLSTPKALHPALSTLHGSAATAPAADGRARDTAAEVATLPVADVSPADADSVGDAESGGAAMGTSPLVDLNTASRPAPDSQPRRLNP